MKDILYDEVGFKVVRRFLDEDICALLTLMTLDSNKTRDEPHWTIPENSVKVQGEYWRLFHLMLTEKAEKETGLKLVPTYIYPRVYSKTAFLRPHFDRDECEHSATINLFQDDAWDIQIVDKNNLIHSVHLGIGDAAFYHGATQKHWRVPGFKGDNYLQIFAHWVEKKEGNEKSYWDGLSSPSAILNDLLTEHQ